MTVQAIKLPVLPMPYPVRVNRHRPALREESATWARDMGMLAAAGRPSAHRPIWTSSQFHAMAVDQLTAWALPDASLTDLRLNHRFNLWALAWDDYFASAFKRTGDLTGAHAFTARLHAFLPTEPGARLPAPANAVEEGMADLQQRLFPPKMAHWRRGLNRALARYIDAGVQELANSRAGRVPDLVEYAQFRRESFAAYTAPYSVELATGARIPEQIRYSRAFGALLDAFMDYMGMANDIASYQREVHDEHDVNNLVVVLQSALHLTVQEAMDAAADLVTARLRHFEHLIRNELPPVVQRAGLNHAARIELDAWLRGARSFLSGLHAWYTGALRYAPADGPFPAQRTSPAALPPAALSAAARYVPAPSGRTTPTHA
ncbi:terpene synthase family protein [Streptomyces sp. NPDC023588]|uniref:terpene synthase family protein n=1 Tax=Streptomyces sp. NPDC023588 TaxID=3154907 RepID=UPI0033D6691C